MSRSSEGASAVDSTAATAFKQSLGTYLGVAPGNVFLFWKGRVALYAILRAIDIQPGDEVIIPAFTCVVVANAISYIGATPVYADIDRATYNMDAEHVEARITPRTRAIVAQNTFGLAPDLDRLSFLAAQHDLRLVEDCTHGFGGRYRGRLNGTIADASFFSSQWNKPFSTGIGGIAVATDKRLLPLLATSEQAFIPPGRMESLALRALLSTRAVLKPAALGPLVSAYRWLAKHDLVVGSSQGNELASTAMPVDFPKQMSDTQATCGAHALADVDRQNDHRRRVARGYGEVLEELGVQRPAEPDYATHTFLRYPVLVKDRDAFVRRAQQYGIDIGDWFNSPLHPVQRGLERWGYRWGQNPVAETISRHIVNLPTHTGISVRDLDRTRDFLRHHHDDLMTGN